MIDLTVDLRQVGFNDLYGFWTVVCILVAGLIGLFAAPNDVRSIAKYIGLATAVAPFAAACLSVPIWIVIKVA